MVQDTNRGVQSRTKTRIKVNRLFFVIGLLVLVCIFDVVHQRKMMQMKSNKSRCEKVIDEMNLFQIPDEDIIDNMDNNALYLLFDTYVNLQQYHCCNITRQGPKQSSGKNICEDYFFKPRSKCIVYSFGSQLNFDFEESIWRSFKCEIHTFDPSMPVEGKTLPTFIDYHLIGLSGKNFIQTEPEKWRHHDNPLLKTWKMQTLSSIMDTLNHSDTTIDILKIDIEGWEWNALPDMIKTGILRHVKQLCIELHFGYSFKYQTTNGRIKPVFTKNTWGNVPINGQIKLLKQLFNNRFRIVRNEPLNWGTIEIENKVIRTLNELTLINLRFLP